NGVGADKETKEEVAQFAACFSRAWDSGMSSADVYCLHRSQISKSSNKGYLATGSFLMSGEREWFKGMPLVLYAFVEDSEYGKLFKLIPKKTYEVLKPKNSIEVKPGKQKKSDASKQLAKELGFNDIDYIMQQLPSGSFQVKK
ncbi:MAG: NFACT RNA binding domain-containing protein, partial [Candidatus Micrarchaeia archaeon]